MSMSLDDQVQAPSIGDVRLVEEHSQPSGDSYASGQPPSMGSLQDSQLSGGSDYCASGQPPSMGSVRPFEHSQLSPESEMHQALTWMEKQFSLEKDYLEDYLDFSYDNDVGTQDGLNIFASQQYPGGYVKPYQYQQQSEGEFTIREIAPERSFASERTKSQETGPAFKLFGVKLCPGAP